ncbi:MAG: TatD family hydrolase [Clostridiales bacterium]|nr:TatD family hydrolase [Clostridiales bacterium]
MLFDTHAHLTDEAFDEDRDELIQTIKNIGVSFVLNAATCLKTSYKSLELAEKHDFIYASVGVHPHDCSGAQDGDLEKIAKLASHKKAVAIGEIGLDYHYDFSPRELQKVWFNKQMELARDLHLPVIIHDREAHEDTLEIVKKYKLEKGVFHCYSGSLEMAKELIKLGFYLSFTGAITFKNARRSPEIIKWIPEDRIMIETDSPYMTPEPYRGKRNHPGMVRFVAEKIAEIRGSTFSEIAALTTKNGREFFHI